MFLTIGEINYMYENQLFGVDFSFPLLEGIKGKDSFSRYYNYSFFCNFPNYKFWMLDF
jgi:hypothetical protein